MKSLIIICTFLLIVFAEKQFTLTYVVDQDIDTLWGMISDWSDATNMVNVESLTVDADDSNLRTIVYVGGNSVVQQLENVDAESRTMVVSINNQHRMEKLLLSTSLSRFYNSDSTLVTLACVGTALDASLEDEVFDGAEKWLRHDMVLNQAKWQRTFQGLVNTKMQNTAIITANIDDVWAVQSRFDAMNVWYKTFSDVKVTGDPKTPGAARECVLVDKGKFIRETLVAYSDEDYTYSYHLLGYNDASEDPLGGLVIRNHRADVTLTPVSYGANGKGLTLVRWSISFDTQRDQLAKARGANQYVFKALFTMLQEYFDENPGSGALVEPSVSVNGLLRQACLLDERTTVGHTWTALRSKDLPTTEPAWSTLVGQEGEYRRSFNTERLSAIVDEIAYLNYKDNSQSVIIEDLEGHSGQRLLLRVDNGPLAERVVYLTTDNVDDTESGEVLTALSTEFCPALDQYALPRENPCCSFPCKHGAVCVQQGQDYTCDCPAGYYGKNCDQAEFLQGIKDWLKPSIEMEEYLRSSFWSDPLNHFPVLTRFTMRMAVSAKLESPVVPAPFSTSHPYRTVEGALNKTFYSRLLPPVPEGCPKAAGFAGPAEYPPIDEVANVFLKRRNFVPSSEHTSVLLAIYAQHFTHQFFKTDPKLANEGITWSDHYIDMNQVYGSTVDIQHMLREHKGGRMKMRTVNGRTVPPLLSDLPDVPAMVEFGYHTIDRNKTWALGHPFFALFPGLGAMSTIWLREHNRIAGLMEQANPDMTDEQIFQATRNVLILICMRITVEDYVGANLAKGKFEFKFIPDLMQGHSMQWQNRIAIEFNHLYHWHPFLPDVFEIGDDKYSMKELLFNTEFLEKHDVSAILDSFSRQIAGETNGPNFDKVAGLYVAKAVIQYGRSIRLQPLNQYRIQVGLEPYTEFSQMNTDPEVVKELERLYEHPDAVEMFPGMFIEYRRPGGLFGNTITQRGTPSTFQGVFGHPLLSPEYWRPSTFGGQVGWDIANGDHTMQSLIRRNTQNWEGPGDEPRGIFRVSDPKKLGWDPIWKYIIAGAVVVLTTLVLAIRRFCCCGLQCCCYLR